MRTGDTLELPFEQERPERKVLTVSDLNRETRLLIEGGLGIVWVEGEVSNLSRPSSGHLYFSLKDTRAQVRCAMFKQQSRRLPFQLADGQQILVRARVSLYEARGEFQLVVEQVEEAGEGLLRRRFEELKRKLAAEGLFDADRKRPRPRFPTRIGVVTSSTGAALHDVLTALRRRFPALPVLVYPTTVQGHGAAAEICRTLELADRRRDCDLLILTRGGGSLEDLWAFNEEPVARAIAAMSIPVIVGVGHEVDFTIADFAADLRAPTPSQAAELAVPESAECLLHLQRLHQLLGRAVQRRVAHETRRHQTLAHRLQRCHPGVGVRERHQRLDELEARLRRALERRVSTCAIRLERLGTALGAAGPAPRVAKARDRWRWADQGLRSAIARHLERTANRLTLTERSLHSLSPLATLERGYAIVCRRDDQHVLTDSTEAPRGTTLAIRLSRGRLTATVDDTEPPD
jgi:exodeoxyribonuclease VII large subunit